MKSLSSADIFCRVVDNFGDIGVCWRLARQLLVEHGLTVRLWVDDLASFRWLCPAIRPDTDRQSIDGVDVRWWHGGGQQEVPHDLVIEAFACNLPSDFSEAMAARRPQPCWVNLEYLSAEDWVRSCHGMVSLHPQLSLRKYFFFPGVQPETGGLLCEQPLARDRQAIQNTPGSRQRFLRQLQLPDLTTDAAWVSLFAYENLSVPSVLLAMASSTKPVICLVPESRVLASVAQWLGTESVRPGSTCRRGALVLHVLPFLSQPLYDQLLWLCDLNFVRGEDSLARALWAARPCVWQIYPQEDLAHWPKLDALFAVYADGMSAGLRAEVQSLWHAWNRQQSVSDLWQRLGDHWPVWSAHAETVTNRLAGLGDLANNLLHFCRKTG